jgi:lipoprotein NlpD
MVEHIATKRVNGLISISHILIIILLVIHLSGCGGHVYHVVEPGESLYSIGWLYGYDYRQIARWNGIKPPYSLRKGQRLRVAPPGGGKAYSKQAPTRSATYARFQGSDIQESTHKGDKNNDITGSRSNTGGKKALVWKWPLKGGKVVQTFDASKPGRKGLDFIGHEGQSIYSAASGRVVYSGSGLPRYGKLIIVKHSNEFLSAYAHNKRLLVKEGDSIKAGQHIADMGRTSANKIMLHFEIRQEGKPVNPLGYLPAQ